MNGVLDKGRIFLGRAFSLGKSRCLDNLTLFRFVSGSAFVSVFVSTAAQAVDEHMVSASYQVTNFSTKLGAQGIQVTSLFGLVARYDYRPGFSSSFYTSYVVASDGKGIILSSYGFGGDYALLGGTTKRFAAGEDNNFEFYYGYRLTAFGGFTFGTYDLSSQVQAQAFTLGEKIRSKGRISGFEAGLGLEFNLSSDTILVNRIGYSSPSVENNTKQSGTVLTVSVGLGKIL